MHYFAIIFYPNGSLFCCKSSRNHLMSTFSPLMINISRPTAWWWSSHEVNRKKIMCMYVWCCYVSTVYRKLRTHAISTNCFCFKATLYQRKKMEVLKKGTLIDLVTQTPTNLIPTQIPGLAITDTATILHQSICKWTKQGAGLLAQVLFFDFFT